MLPRLTIVVLISGRGTNLQAIIDAIAGGSLPADLRAVICNEPDAPGIERAKNAGIEVIVVNHRDFASRERFDAALAGVPQRVTRRGRPVVVVLAVEEYERLRHLEQAPTFADLILAIPQDDEEFDRLPLPPRPVDV